jgi:hypothetical protein
MKFSRGFLIAKGFYRYIVERKSIKESFASKKTVLKNRNFEGYFIIAKTA